MGPYSLYSYGEGMDRAKQKKRIWLVAGICILAIPGFFGIANAMVLNAGRGKIYENKQTIPHHRVGIVLGCSPRFAFFRGRMQAAADLYKAGKIDRLLVSGDNGSKGYDEPSAMEKALVAKGVPKEHITKDSAGFRTLDSMVRAKKIFDLADATIITDDFHMARSIYYAENAGLEVDGYPSRADENPKTNATEFREVLARGRAVLDEVLHVDPKFLGKKEVIR